MSCRPHSDSALESVLAGLRTYNGGIWAGDSGCGEAGADVGADEDVTMDADGSREWMNGLLSRNQCPK